MSELEKVTELCIALGAASGQATTMARQLMKRADQLAAERGISRQESMDQLLQILVQGRQGKVPVEFKPPAPRSP